MAAIVRSSGMSSSGSVPCDQRRRDSNIGSARNAREGCCIQASTIRGRVTRPIVAGGAVDASLPIPSCNASLDE
jgi:hypothetical protein